MPFRFRPFGLLGSGLEVLRGGEILRLAVWNGEAFQGWVSWDSPPLAPSQADSQAGPPGE